MVEDDESIVDITLREVADLGVISQYVSVIWTTEHREDDVTGRRVVVFCQQMLTSYRSRRAYNNSLVCTS